MSCTSRLGLWGNAPQRSLYIRVKYVIVVRITVSNVRAPLTRHCYSLPMIVWYKRQLIPKWRKAKSPTKAKVARVPCRLENRVYAQLFSYRNLTIILIFRAKLISMAGRGAPNLVPFSPLGCGMLDKSSRNIILKSHENVKAPPEPKFSIYKLVHLKFTKYFALDYLENKKQVVRALRKTCTESDIVPL